MIPPPIIIPTEKATSIAETARNLNRRQKRHRRHHDEKHGYKDKKHF